MWIPHNDGVPNAMRPAKVKHQHENHQEKTQKRGEHGRTDDGLKFLNVENVNDGAQRKAAGSETDAAENVEADPQSPRKLIAKIGGRAQALGEADVRRVKAKRQKHDEYAAREGYMSQ